MEKKERERHETNTEEIKKRKWNRKIKQRREREKKNGTGMTEIEKRNITSKR